MASLDTTSFAAALKSLYPKGLAEILYPECPLFAWLPKKTDFYGDYWDLAPFYGGTMGSNSFDDALANKSNISTTKFRITRARSYAIASVDAETMAATANNKGAFARALDKQTRGATYTVGRAIAHQLYGNSGGARGKGDGSYTITGDEITLNDRRDIVHFEVGLKLQFSTADGTSGAVKPGEVTVASINVGAGTITTVESNISLAITGAANSDYIFRRGDFGTSMMGLHGWLPTTAPTSGDSHFGVDRSTFVERLAGVRVSGGGKLMEEVIADAIAECHLHGGKPDTIFMNSLRFAELMKSVQSKVWIPVSTDIPGIGFKALAVPTSHGTIKVLDDPNCPWARAYLLDRSTWEYKSLGKSPHFAMDDGKKHTREVASDGVEFRIRNWANLGCDTPGHNAVISW